MNRLILRTNHRRHAFSLIELLTVIFIISLLIGILIPSLNSARNTAKNTSTKAAFNSIKVALDMFKNDHERKFRQTNGYVPSFAHPRMVKSSGGDIFSRWLGQFPFYEDKPVVSGAHWLPAMLMGVDQQGYIARSTVPNKDDLRDEPWKWYTPDPLGTGIPLERSALYLDPGSIRTARTGDLTGTPNLALMEDSNWGTFSAPGQIQSLPVIIDAFGQPILYYAANKGGRPQNMVGDEYKEDNIYSGGLQQKGPPYYFHIDNHMFTGDDDKEGWDFGDGAHPIQESGEELTAEQLMDPKHRNTFARFVLDRTQYRDFTNKLMQDEQPDPKTPLRPVNSDSYILMSAGVDTLFGSNDDVTNFITDLE